MGKVIDLAQEKQKEQPIAQAFIDAMENYTDNDIFRDNVNSICTEIADSFGCTDEGYLYWMIKGFTMALVEKYG